MQMADAAGKPLFPGYSEPIALLSFSHSVVMQVSGDVRAFDRTIERPFHNDFAVTKYLDAASPLLNQACCEGKLLPQVMIRIEGSAGDRAQEFMEYTLKNVVMTSIAVSGGREHLPIEVLTLNYTHIRWDFAGANGTVAGSWDLAKNGAE